ncbi:MAG: Crp/Fnr family transcriptional regulator [Chitinophagaceae bacterium]
MYEVFFQKFNDKIVLTGAEEALVKKYLTPKKLRKKQYWLQEGEICKSICVVEKGALRSYLMDEAGNERITAFALEGWTMGDLYSFIKEEPATLNIDALEDCELVLISKAAYTELLKVLPKFETYMRILMTDAYMAIQKRTTNMISLSLEEQYIAFTQMYPAVLQRVPQHMIASHMGVTPETLSRIRSKLNTRK